LGEDTTRAEAQEFLNDYFNTFTRLAEFLEETKSFARETGYTKTMFGRRRHFAGITSSVPFIRAQAERMAINAPIQGTEGDILRIAMREIATWNTQEKNNNDVRMLLQVHDELIFEIHDSAVKTAVPTIVDIMESVFVDKETHGVPVEVEVKVGKNWNEMSELQ
jgi:DNA polymerase-1